MRALAKRNESDIVSMGATAPPAFWAMKVMTDDIKDKIKKGIFSLVTEINFCGFNNSLYFLHLSIACSPDCIRLRGQKSRSRSRNGKVTSMGFAIKPMVKNIKVSR